MVRKKIVVLGGGSAGWLAALFLKKNWNNLDVSVVEDPNLQPIIAGESCTIPFVDLLEFLEIPIDVWSKEVGAIPKLGGKFANWSGDNNFFIQPLFSRYLNRYLFNYPEFGNQNDLLCGMLALGLPVSNLSVAAKLIEHKKVPFVNNQDSPILTTMWHFDSRKNAEYLKNLGINRSITLIERKFLSATIDNTGSIDSIILENQEKIFADWFFDCSGLSQLLLKKTLNCSFKNFEDSLPVNSVVAWWDDSSNLPYTEMTALKNGWTFDVSLADRSGKGYVYNNSYITKDQAVDEINQTFKKEIVPIASLTWDRSLCLSPWTKNVIGLGLSVGFPEPLGSPGHTLIGLQLRLLSEIWNPASRPGSSEEDTYNKKYNSMIIDIIDFINLHYINSRRDSNFWQDQTHRLMPESLTYKLKEWQNGNILFDEDPVYSFENYAAVLQGNKIINFEILKEKLKYKRNNILDSIHQEYRRLVLETELMTNNCLHISQWRKND